MSDWSKGGDEGWLWDGCWEVRTKVGVNSFLPSYILAGDEMWQLEYEGSVRRCHKCLADHPFWRCQARDREEEVGRWTSDLGSDVEIFL